MTCAFSPTLTTVAVDPAARGSLKTAPAYRLRRTYLHLSCSYARLFSRSWRKGSHVPHKGLGQSHATSMPDVTQASCSLSLGWSRANDSSRFRHRPYAFDTFTVVHNSSSLCPIPDAVMPRRFP